MPERRKFSPLYREEKSVPHPGAIDPKVDSPRPSAETPQVDLPRRGAKDPLVDHVDTWQNRKK